MKDNFKATASFAASMLIFSTIGIFRRAIPLPSGFISAARAAIGVLFLLAVMLIRRKPISKEAVLKNLVPLCLSGAFIGFNWILLFEAYRYTSVATATLCYYMAPVFVTVLSPFVLKERLTKTKALCALVAALGMAAVSGIVGVSPAKTSATGVLLGLGAALFYASSLMLNKKIKNIDAFDKAVVQLSVGGIVVIPYTLAVEEISISAFTPTAVCLLIVLGIVHTGIAYALNFNALGKLPILKIAIFSYIDPVVAVLLSALVLHESMTAVQWVGAVLILSATLLSEISDKRAPTYQQATK